MNAGRETRIINALMTICLALGFACFVFIILPEQLRRSNVSFPSAGAVRPKSLTTLIETEGPEPKPEPAAVSGETIAKFTPEPPPTLPGVMEEANSTPVAEPETGGPEGEGSLMSNAYGQADVPEPPEKKTHPLSSLALGAPSSLDTLPPPKGKEWVRPPEGLNREVTFWRDIYTKYDKNQVVLHHPRYLDIIYDVVDLTDIDGNPRLSEIEREHMKEKRVEERREQITDTLLKLSANPKATEQGSEEWRIKKLFHAIDEDDVFKRAVDKYGVRAQVGQKDKFIKGLAVSGRYLGEIEAIFDGYGLPRELTRLIFVESMFDTKATSSAGAAGIWQFMRGTGRLYLKINKLVDERYDPIAATHAAAKLLRHNYNELGTWPLAINAYNTGRGRMAQAVRHTGSTDIEKIIRDFEHSAYGFASRNFFLEFLAALDIAEHAELYFGPIKYDEPLRYEIVRPTYHISLPEVARLAGIEMDEILTLNAGLGTLVMSGKQILPAGFTLRVPEGKGELFLALAARAPKSRSGPFKHVAERGETLPSIAEMYGVPLQALRDSNRGVSRRPHQGQIIVIPQ